MIIVSFSWVLTVTSISTKIQSLLSMIDRQGFIFSTCKQRKRPWFFHSGAVNRRTIKKRRKRLSQRVFSRCNSITIQTSKSQIQRMNLITTKIINKRMQPKILVKQYPNHTIHLMSTNPKLIGCLDIETVIIVWIKVCLWEMGCWYCMDWGKWFSYTKTRYSLYVTKRVLRMTY